MKQLPSFIKMLWRTPVWRMNPDEKVIYLTFDDGPNPQVTPAVLDILDKYAAKATFFCVGENVIRFPDVFNEIKKRDHTVGNHTFNHLKGFETSTDVYVANVRKAGECIRSKLFRPPHGRIKPSQVKALRDEYQLVLWDFITYDYDRNVSPAQILKEIKKRSRNGSIVVFHDSLKAEQNVLSALPEALKFWKEEGYRFGIISRDERPYVSTTINEL